jgi:hypothetical protein
MRIAQPAATEPLAAAALALAAATEPLAAATEPLAAVAAAAHASLREGD